MNDEYVLDANIIMGAMISGKPIYLSLFENHKFFIINEIEKYKSLIVKKTKLKSAVFEAFVCKLFQHLTIIPSSYISDDVLKSAINLCSDIDSKDTMYVALALQMKITLLTRDILLYKGLLRKGFNNVALFDDFLTSKSKS